MAERRHGIKASSEFIAASKVKETSIKSFELNSTKKLLSKKELEGERKKKDEVDAALVYEEFVASFEDTQKGGVAKTWVKGGVVNSDTPDDGREEKGRLYKPTSKLAEFATTVKESHESKESRNARKERERESRFEPQVPATGSSLITKNKKKDEKRKSNLELFKEELKLIQEERDQRHRAKRLHREMAPMDADEGSPEPVPEEQRTTRLGLDFLDMSIPFGKGSVPVDPGDESTTNIYVGNINPKMTETQLCEAFGKYGPLASIKIMWPRTEEERSRGRNCGFVAFMNRRDGERAMNTLRGKDIQGFEMKLGWGKAVPIPAHPIYIPPALAELTQPPPQSGLPFNAQVYRKSKGSHGTLSRNQQRQNGRHEMRNHRDVEELEKTLAKAVVKVTIPSERAQLILIHRMVEYVVREGPMFEAMIMNRELNNPQYRFLFENQSSSHLYYRWKLFSILQGDSPYKWRAEEFRMFKGGSVWRPPPVNPYLHGMPDELVEKEFDVDQDSLPVLVGKKGSLTDSQRDRLEDMVRQLSPERDIIGQLMIWCLDHAEAAEEIVDCISESLSIAETPLPKKIARLYLVSDILYNSSAKVPNASFYRKCFQLKLKAIFAGIQDVYRSIEGRLKAEQFKQRVMACFRAWEDWAIYPNDFLIGLQNIFLGLVLTAKSQVTIEESSDLESGKSQEGNIDDVTMEDLDGAPLLMDGDLDGVPLAPEVLPTVTEVAADGEGISEDLDGDPLNLELAPDAKKMTLLPSFTRSKWELVDEAELEAQAITVSKWDRLEVGSDEGKNDGARAEEDIDGVPMPETAASLPSNDGSSDSDSGAHRKQQMSEEMRMKLREIEMKVVKYQDDVEAGRRSLKSGFSLSQQVAHYRKKLVKKIKSQLQERNDNGHSPATDSRKRQRVESPAVPPCAARKRAESPVIPLSAVRKRAESPVVPLSAVRSHSPNHLKKSKSPKRSKHSRSKSPKARSPHNRKHRRRHRE